MEFLWGSSLLFHKKLIPNEFHLISGHIVLWTKLMLKNKCDTKVSFCEDSTFPWSGANSAKRTTSLSYQITIVLFRWRTQTLLKGIWIPLSHSVCMALEKGSAICDKNKLEIPIHYCSTMNSACFWKEMEDMFTFLWHNQWATSKGWKKMFTKNLTEPTLLSK